MILAPESTHHKPCMDHGMRNTNLKPKFHGLKISMQNQSLDQPSRTQIGPCDKISAFWKYPRYFNHLPRGPE